MLFSCLTAQACIPTCLGHMCEHGSFGESVLICSDLSASPRTFVCPLCFAAVQSAVAPPSPPPHAVFLLSLCAHRCLSDWKAR
eukprot:m.592375 g.592375  ORF g.592375 m.592375 type:complete len:83 (+) comp58021_c0_seq22:554-802(+)